MLQGRILVVDDEIKACTFLAEIFSRAGLDVRFAHNGLAALKLAESEDFSAAIVDLKMPGLSGIETIGFLKEIDSDMEVIVFTGYPSLDSSLAAIKHHVFAYISKPADRYVIVGLVARALERRRLIVENRHLVEQLRIERDRLHEEVSAAKRGIEHHLAASKVFVGKSDGIRKVRHFVAQVAPTDLAVLILGESGTGKDVVARLIHEASGRDPDAFVKINCPAIPEGLFESELFGHAPGAFTGGGNGNPGQLKMAAGGTVFLDEIGELPFKLQSKLLQVIEDKCFTPLGSSGSTEVDLRIIAATNAPLKMLIDQNRFRSDLFYRLNDYAIELSPLRHRRQDIPELIHHFCSIYSRKFHRTDVEIPDEILTLATQKRWPGNVRELEAFIRRFVLDGDKARALEFLNSRVSSLETLPQSAAGVVRKAEIDAVLDALVKTRWNRRKAAELLGMSYSSLRRRIAKYDLTRG